MFPLNSFSQLLTNTDWLLKSSNWKKLMYHSNYGDNIAAVFLLWRSTLYRIKLLQAILQSLLKVVVDWQIWTVFSTSILLLTLQTWGAGYFVLCSWSERLDIPTQLKFWKVSFICLYYLYWPLSSVKQYQTYWPADLYLTGTD